MSALTKPPLFASAEDCEQAFYEALASGDLAAVVDLWLDDEDVVCVHPGGPRLTGYAAVRASWEAILSNGPVHVRSTRGKSLETPTVTLHNVVEEIVVGEGRQQQVVSVVATNAYVKTPAGWKMVLHHASPAPDGEPAHSEPPGRLH